MKRWPRLYVCPSPRRLAGSPIPPICFDVSSRWFLSLSSSYRYLSLLSVIITQSVQTPHGILSESIAWTKIRTNIAQNHAPDLTRSSASAQWHGPLLRIRCQNDNKHLWRRCWLHFDSTEKIGLTLSSPSASALTLWAIYICPTPSSHMASPSLIHARYGYSPRFCGNLRNGTRGPLASSSYPPSSTTSCSSSSSCCSTSSLNHGQGLSFSSGNFFIFYLLKFLCLYLYWWLVCVSERALNQKLKFFIVRIIWYERGFWNGYVRVYVSVYIEIASIIRCIVLEN